jgi:hypothetical protein
MKHKLGMRSCATAHTGQGASGATSRSEDIEISVADLPMDNDCYVCPVCKKEVARRFPLAMMASWNEKRVS